MDFGNEPSCSWPARSVDHGESVPYQYSCGIQPEYLGRTVVNNDPGSFSPRTQARTMWSLSNAFTSAFKELDPIPRFKATAKLGEFLEARFSQSF